jgi:enoyl-CoA hydratase/carnithine racemase
MRPFARRLCCLRQPNTVQFSTAAEGPEPSVLIAKASGLRVVDFNRPKALNALNEEMIDIIYPLIQDWQRKDGDVKLVVFRGSGERAFCAGGDIRFLHDSAASLGGAAPAMAHTFFAKEYKLNNALGTSVVPVVSIVDGIVMGGGVGLSVHGQYRIATENTLFAMPETGIGFFPDVGGSYFLPRLPGGLAMGNYLGLTGARLSGRDAVTAGVATHFVPVDRLETLEGILAEIADQGLNAGHVNLNVLSSSIAALDKLDAKNVEPSFIETDADEIAACFSHDDVDEILDAVAVLAGQKPGSWADKANKALKRGSPTSIKVTHELLRRGAALPDLASCLQLEYIVAQRFMKHTDFVKGVSAVLGLDGGKKGAPVDWASAPSGDELESFFIPGEGGELEF